MNPDPIALFDGWYSEAQNSEPDDWNAMGLATVDPSGQPSVRIVLLKEHDTSGFVFYTNRESRKAEELAVTPKAALVFHWKLLRRQIRVEGPVHEVSGAESDAYFATRDRNSQLGAWASAQSRPLDERATFDARYEEARARFEIGDVPRPPHWGGYRLVPHRLEFWQDHAHRLHERRIFERTLLGWGEGLLYP